MTHHLDALETRAPEVRETALMAALPAQIAHAQKHSAAFAEILQGVDAARVNNRAALAALPVTRKYELLARQQALRAQDPFGGFSTIGWKGLLRSSGARRVYQSPGPIYEPEGQAPDYWRAARAMAAAGFEAGDLVHNCFSYHLTPGAWIMESGAHALGCTVIPGGVGNTEQQLAAIADLRPVAYAGTPSFLKILIEKAAEAGTKLSITKAMVSGEACPPSLRDWFAQQGVAAYQSYATADVGLIAYETSAREGLVLDEGVIVEIVRPGTGARRIGRIVQRLCEIETYRAMSMLGLMRARGLTERLNALDPRLSALVSGLDGVQRPAEAALHELLTISAELESLAVKHSFRFGATGAYEAIVTQRIAALREERVQGRQSFGECVLPQR